MKKLVLLIAATVFGMGTHAATTSEATVINYRYGNSFIFTENGVTFSVYPDGEFDFYIDNRVNVGVGARIGNVGITFNSGFNYNPFVQYDDYGAVVQVENVPIFYDYYGRVSQIGGVDVWYRNGRVRRLGGLNVFYNGGVFSHYTGFINIYNRGYVYRPFHRWFARPAVGFCNVWATPYRRWYNPVRYTWYSPYRNNIRRTYAQVGREYRYNRTRRANIYRNDNRVAVRENRGRRSADFNRRNDAMTQRRSVTRSNTHVNRNNGTRGNSVNRTTTSRRTAEVGRSNRGTSVTQRSVTRTPRSTTVTKREVTRTPNNRTVTKRSTTYTKPRPSVAQNRSRTTSVKRSSSPAKRTVSRSTTSTRRSSGATTRSSRSSSTRSARR